MVEDEGAGPGPWLATDDVQRRLRDLVRTRFSPERFRGTLVEAMSHLGVAPPQTPIERRAARG